MSKQQKSNNQYGRSPTSSKRSSNSRSSNQHRSNRGSNNRSSNYRGSNNRSRDNQRDSHRDQTKENPNSLPSNAQNRWYRVDLHLHTPASNDYEEPKATYLDWMRTVAERGLEVVAITDHNTVAGVGAIRQEVEWLTKLEEQKRLTKEEKERLEEWRKLSENILVLPGFEFTATFGFHILGIFPPETPTRTLEHLLLTLSVPPEKLDIGTSETGASTDVITAYKIIREAGGLVIAAHANSTHGVAMRDFPFGGQTKIAYTQDTNLDALEVTDLHKRYRSTARFFNGNKNEYPRRMHCFQGSDAHRLTCDPKNPKRLGIGERASEFLMPEASFEAIAELIRGSRFERTRPARPQDEPFDPVAVAREEGPSISQSFHESASARSVTSIMNDICAFANTIGGSVYVGVGLRKGKPKGLTDPQKVQQELQTAIDEKLTPLLNIKFETMESEGSKILQLQVPKGEAKPYCLDGYRIYIRDENETNLAVRDEIVALVRDSLEEQESNKNSRNRSNANKRRNSRPKSGPTRNASSNSRGTEPTELNSTNINKGTPNHKSIDGSDQTEPDDAYDQIVAQLNSEEVGDIDDAFYLPQVGVEIISTEERKGKKYHTIQDLRNGNVIKNVTRRGARKLWSYAIQKHEDKPASEAKIDWQGGIGIVNIEDRAGKVRYDLALKEDDVVRVFYGVTDDGMDGRWSIFIQDE